jgi:hypothetical protein
MAQIQKGTTYSTGDQVTATNLNALADAAILLPGAITDQTAKTVPLAADTVLIHSAADTALRKSTLTQLFSNATGIPISTGISGLGTGIATALAINTGSAGAPVLFNGALGTPASGTVTNLTGTASININGTVGATTPSTLAATTGTFTATGQVQYFSGATTASKYIRLENTGGNSYFGIEGATPAFGGTAYAAFLFAPSEIDMLVGSVKVGAFTATGLNSTPIGVTTASTGAFTTLSTSGNATLGDVPSADTHTVNGITTFNFDLNGVGKLVLNNQNVGAASSSALVFGDTGTERWKWASYRDGTGQIRLSIVGGSDILNVSSTGLAVTGALSATGAISGSTISTTQGTTTPSKFARDDLTSQFVSIWHNASGGHIEQGGTVAKDLYLSNASGGSNVYIGASSAATTVAISSTGLAVTGALSSTGNATFGSTATSGSITLGQVTNTTVDNSIRLRTGSTKTAWQIGAQFNVDNGFEITPSTAAGGTTFSTPAVVVTSSGNVGIGTSSPAYKLDVNGTLNWALNNYLTSGGLKVAYRAATNNFIYSGSSSLRINNDADDFSLVTVLNSGNVGISTTTIQDKLHISGSGTQFVRVGSETGSAYRGYAFGSGAADATQYGQLEMELSGGQMRLVAGKSGFGGFLTIHTNGAERARIDTGGNLLVGVTTAAAEGGFTLYPQGSSGAPLLVWNRASTANSTTAADFRNGSSSVGNITYTNTTTLFTNLSDHRRKSNVQDLTGSGTFIDALKPRTFDWDTGDKGVGFIAHEFAEVSPSSVSGEKDAVDSDGKPVYQAMQASSAEVIANLVAELQSLRQRVAALESN